MRSLVIAIALAVVPSVAHAEKPAKAAASEKVAVAKCDHGVEKGICTRCNPKLAPVFKSKGDWCPEHDRPESQCSLCHPELARQGVK